MMDKVTALYAVAEEQSKAAQALIDQAEKKAGLLQAATEALAKGLQNVTPTIQGAVEGSVQASMSRAAGVATRALEDAAAPTVERLHQASGQAKTAADALGDVLGALRFRFVLVLCVTAMVWMVVMVGAAWGVNAYQLHQVQQLQAEIRELAVQRDQMQATVAALERRGGRLIVANCGGQMCIQAASNQRTRARWAAPWELPPNNQPAFIPARAPQ